MTRGNYRWIYPDEPSHIFMSSIRECRKRQGLTAREVAEKLGIDVSSYRRYERGAAIPSLEKLIKTAEILGYDISESFNYKYYYGKISRLKIRRSLKHYGITHEELSYLTGYSKVQIRNTLYNCCEGSMSCLGAIYEVIEHEKATERLRHKERSARCHRS